MPFFRALRQRLFSAAPDTATPVVLGARRIYILPSGAGLLWAASLFVMLLCAINYGLGLGYAFVFLLCGLALVGMIHTFRNLYGLRLTAADGEPVFAGDIAHFRLHLAAPDAVARRALDAAFDGQKPATLNLSQPAGDTIALAVPAVRRGMLDPGPLTVATRYPLGLFRAWSRLRPPLRCLVYPRPIVTPLPPRDGSGDAGQAAASAGDEDFSGLRPYQPSDSPKRIAWKAAARDDTYRPLLVKQFAGTDGGELTLDWRAIRADADPETRLSILCGWVLAAEELRLHYALALPGLALPAGTGPAHRDACLAALARHETTD